MRPKHVLHVRDATPQDLPAIFAIYDREVLEGTATFDTVVYTPEQRASYFAEHARPDRPLLVATLETTAGREVVGFASLSAWSARCAYARAAEISVYVAKERKRRGAGRALLAELIARGRAAKLGVLLSRITADSRASVALHEAFGFRHVGTLRRVGEKLGRVLDVELYELQL